jgi:hypothetical protein
VSRPDYRANIWRYDERFDDSLVRPQVPKQEQPVSASSASLNREIERLTEEIGYYTAVYSSEYPHVVYLKERRKDLLAALDSPEDGTTGHPTEQVASQYAINLNDQKE